jgi:hypothetical protein
MPGAFHYRPKFVDIRVRKPQAESQPRQPGERACDHVNCTRAGVCKAPKSRDRVGDYWWFCQEHASDYNRRWNYFEGMSTEEYTEFARAEEVGHRPTWTFRPGSGDRESAVRRAFNASVRRDRFGLFRGGKDPAQAERRRLSRLEELALQALNLDEEADAPAIRARYAELVKRYHPDSNGGDRTTEPLLDKVVKAYQVLKQGGHV